MIYYPIPQDQLPVYKGQYQTLVTSEQLSQEVVSLPIWPEMEEDTLKRVTNGFSGI
jgi:dTDP-4-amino-4,6-dideoxygalactose transaminase